MQNIQILLAAYLKEKGITISHVSKVSKIKYELLRRSLNGKRVLTADELVSIIKSTDIKLDDIIKEQTKC